jgi:acetyltransferase
MNKNPLYQLMNPTSVAIVGAGNNPSKMGTLHGQSIVKGGFQGKVYPIHLRDKKVMGRMAYKSVSDLPETPDLAMLIVPAEHTIKLLEDFGQIGVKNVIVVTAGFRETGEDGQKLEEQLKETARRFGIRFLGPNCIGIINSEIGLNMTVMPAPDKPGKLGMASQSGTYVTQTLPYLREKGIFFSKAISVGNEANIDIVDALEYLGNDEQTSAIALYIEGIRDGRRFIEVAQRITPHKPVIAQYVGGSAAGARAGMSHTGSMAGPDFLYEGIFKQAGIIRADSIEELYSHGWALATQPRLRGNRVAVVTNSGGPGTAIADTCEKNKLSVPRFSDELQKKIRADILDHASSSNPVDLTFHMDATLLTTDIPELIMQSGEVDSVILHGGMSHGFIKELYPQIKGLLSGLPLSMLLKQFKSDMEKTVSLPWKYDIPLISSSFFGSEDNYTAAYRENNISVFDGPEKAAKAMATLLKYKEITERPNIEAKKRLPISNLAVDIIATGQNAGHKALDEYQSKQILAAYGIPMSDEQLAKSEEEAVVAAAKIGYPVVLKGCAPQFAHKTEKGLVRLNLVGEIELRQTYREILVAAEEVIPVLVSPMLKGKREVMAGMARFPGFGPCILFGLGGIYTEAFKDITFRAAPFTHTEAKEMIADIRAKAILQEFRGMPPVDSDALATLLTTLSQIALLHPEIAEIDINPIIIEGNRPIVADALIIL